MNVTNAVVTSVVVVVGTSMFRLSRQGKAKGNTIEIIVFGFMLLISLLIIAMVLPTVALVLAYLAMIGAFIANGPEIFKFVKDFGGRAG